MLRENIHDLIALAAAAGERSFTRAAAWLGVSQSALRHTIKRLETRLVIPCRPGNCGSNFRAMTGLRDIAPDLACVLDRLGIGTFGTGTGLAALRNAFYSSVGAHRVPA